MDDVLRTVITLLVWMCLALSKRQCWPFRKVWMFSRTRVSEILQDSALTFAPGLLTVLLSRSPLPVSFFSSTPTAWAKLWAVYVLVLLKPGCRPRIYIGSGTGAIYGVYGRMGNYRSGNKIPKWVQIVLKDGYTISHRGLLCWTNIPSAAAVPVLRVVIMTLEGMFSFVFWAMVSKKANGYFMKALCPWDLKDFEYDGCCSHNPLNEAVEGDFDLTPEELEAKAVASTARICKTRHDWILKRRLEFPEVVAAYYERHQLSNLEKGQWTCGPCKGNFRNSPGLKRQLRTQKHARKITATSNNDKERFVRVKGARQQTLDKENGKLDLDIQLQKQSQDVQDSLSSQTSVSAFSSHASKNHDTGPPQTKTAKLPISTIRWREAFKNKKFFCEPCDQPFGDHTALRIHELTKKHARNVVFSSGTSAQHHVEMKKSDKAKLKYERSKRAVEEDDQQDTGTTDEDVLKPVVRKRLRRGRAKIAKIEAEEMDSDMDVAPPVETSNGTKENPLVLF